MVEHFDQRLVMAQTAAADGLDRGAAAKVRERVQQRRLHLICAAGASARADADADLDGRRRPARWRRSGCPPER